MTYQLVSELHMELKHQLVYPDAEHIVAFEKHIAYSVFTDLELPIPSTGRKQ